MGWFSLLAAVKTEKRRKAKKKRDGADRGAFK